MKGLRGLFRLGTLTLLALTLMVAMALPSSAVDYECNSSQMLDEVEIVSVAAKESPAVWSAQDLAGFDYDGDIENGLLEVSFKDISTDFGFNGYIIEAMPGDDDPGNSAELGVSEYTSSLIPRPSVVGSTITEVLNLEPGTKYYVTVYAVNHFQVQISPNQRAQDSSSATTLLSAPFLGALDWGPTVHADSDSDVTTPTTSLGTTAADCQDGTALEAVPAAPAVDNRTCKVSWRLVNLPDSDFKGVHFSLYGVEGEAGQHYFRWLNPGDYGPFDHLLDTDHAPARDANKQADMLSFNKDNEVENHCGGDDFTDGNCGHTHYQFKAVDDNGNTVASELVETDGSLAAAANLENDYFQTVFSAEGGDLTLSVSLGRMVGGKYRAMSDIASVMFEAPDDLRALDQTYDEYLTANMDVTGDVNEADDIERYRDSVFARPGDDVALDTNNEVKGQDDKVKMLAYLNNQLK